MAPTLVPDEEALGPQRRCPRCGCWWPEDARFFVHTQGGDCRMLVDHQGETSATTTTTEAQTGTHGTGGSGGVATAATGSAV